MDCKVIFTRKEKHGGLLTPTRTLVEGRAKVWEGICFLLGCRNREYNEPGRTFFRGINTQSMHRDFIWYFLF